MTENTPASKAPPPRTPRPPAGTPPSASKLKTPPSASSSSASTSGLHHKGSTPKCEAQASTSRLQLLARQEEPHSQVCLSPKRRPPLWDPWFNVNGKTIPCCGGGIPKPDWSGFEDAPLPPASIQQLRFPDFKPCHQGHRVQEERCCCGLLNQGEE